MICRCEVSASLGVSASPRSSALKKDLNAEDAETLRALREA